MEWFKLLSYLLHFLSMIFGIQQAATDTQIKVTHQWTFPDFLYPDEQAKSTAISKKLFIPENTAIIDTDYYTTRVFVTTPQLKDGIPATLSEVVKDVNSKGENLLRPFPNWEAAGSSHCEFARSVFRIHIDKCGLLWVLDSGRVNAFVNTTRECRPKLLIYDLKNKDNLLIKYEFPDTDINEGTNMINLVTESYKDDCLDSIAYIADVNGYGLVVFDLPNKKSWRVTHNYFYPCQNAGTATVAGVTFDLMDGVFGLALGPGDANTRKLYFHSYASFRESWVPVSVLKDTKLIENADQLRPKIVLTEEARDGQSTVEVMTNDGILLFANIPKSAIMCWNQKTEYKKENIHVAYQNDENLQFISGMKLKEDKTLIVTTSRLQNYIVGRANNQDVKYRMIVIDDVHQLLKGSPCKDHA